MSPRKPCAHPQPEAGALTCAIEDAVLSAVRTLTPGRPLIAAVSGGADSTALLYALFRLRKALPNPLRCVHIQHNLRGKESAADEDAVTALCRRLAVHCLVHAIPEGAIPALAKQNGCGIEAAARHLRHNLLREEARQDGAAILIAHTQDDLLETVLMRCLRGAGPAGLAAMPLRRGPILRPLITIRRTQLLGYLKQCGIDFQTDSTNAQEKYLRSRIRARLVPPLAGHFPGWEQNLLKMAETQRLVERYLSRKTARLLKKNTRLSSGEAEVTVQDFFSLPMILREELIFAALNRALPLRGQKDGGIHPDLPEKQTAIPRRKVVRRFCAGTVKTCFLGNAALEKDGNDIRIRAKNTAPSEEGAALVIQEEGEFHIEGLTVVSKKHESGWALTIHKKK